jgi:predicted Fe-Mo cluster-binding NifX family protein
MKIAVSTDQGSVSAHFGRCPSYAIFEINNGIIQSKEEVPNPGHQPGFLPQFLAEKGVQCIIAGGMGPRAQALFAQKNIETIIGVQGSIEDVIHKYMNQQLESGEDLCNHGQDDAEHGAHECGQEPPPLQVHPKSESKGRRICVTSLGPDLESEVDPKFGRAQFFLFFNPETNTFEAIKNPNLEQAHGVGIQTAQLVVNHNVGVVLSGAFGPKAAQVLETAGIQMKAGYSGSVKDALAKFQTEG